MNQVALNPLSGFVESTMKESGFYKVVLAFREENMLKIFLYFLFFIQPIV